MDLIQVAELNELIYVLQPFIRISKNPGVVFLKIKRVAYTLDERNHPLEIGALHNVLPLIRKPSMY